MKKLIPIAVLAACAALSGCATTQSTPQRTALDIQAVQAKTFESDKPTAFKSVVSVLQDLGYVVQAASLDTGIVTAQSPTKRDTSGGAVLNAVLGGVRTEGLTFVTASVDDISTKQTRVRLNFVEKSFRSARNGQTATDERVVEDPKVYNNAFEKIGETIFVRTAQK